MEKQTTASWETAAEEKLTANLGVWECLPKQCVSSARAIESSLEILGKSVRPAKWLSR